MYTIITYTNEIVRDSDGVRFMPDDNDPNFVAYEGWLLSGNKPTQVLGEPLSCAITRLSTIIDKKADRVYTTVLSSAGKLQEYLVAESEAKQFMTDGTVGPNVEVWAQVNGWTNQQSVDSILAAAAKFRQAMAAIRSLRLGAKATIVNYQGTKVAEIEGITSGYLAQLDVIADMLRTVI